jgi:SNF2 family DNA or RNA helicase
LVGQYFKDSLLTEYGLHRFDQFRQEVEKLKEKVDYHEDALSFIAQARDKNILSEVIKKNFPKGIEDPQWDSFCKIGLYSYQRQGALFAAANGRVLMADEMGLGKTIQAIAASEMMARFLGINRVLIICPASLKHQWKGEIEKTVNREVQIVGGQLLERQRQYRQESFFKIINYDVVYRDREIIQRLAPDLIILDEAQRIKNWKTRIAQSVKQLQSLYAIVLTGTPLENRLEELHSIVEFIDRHHLGPLFRFLNNHHLVNDEGKTVGYKNLNELGKSLETVMIRRNRQEVLAQLPDRMDKNYFVPMTPEQISVHEEYRELVARLVNKWRRCHFLAEEEKQRLMMALQKMRMVCNSTYLIDETTNSGNKIGELETQLGEILENAETKIVIFSQWLRTMDLIIRFLNRRKWRYVFLHGGVPSARRGDLIEMFREDKACRFFLSTEAGGVGLNLQQASFVINMDLPWNPAVLEQRIGRVHRLGQKDNVRVINFIAENSIEHGMLGLLKFKKSVFAGVLDDGEDQVLMGESRLNQFMNTFEEASTQIDKEKEAAPARESAAVFPEQNFLMDLRHKREEPRPVSEAIGQPDFPSYASSLSLFIKTAGDFFHQMSEALASAPSGGTEKADREPAGQMRLHTDPITGQKSLHMPLPDDRTLSHLAGVLGKMFNRR